MAKIRLFELARELGWMSKDLMDKAAALGLEVKNHMATLEDPEVDRLRRAATERPATVAPASAPAEPRVAADTKEAPKGQVVERRLGATLIRRRSAAPEPPTPRPRAPAPRPSAAALPPVTGPIAVQPPESPPTPETPAPIPEHPLKAAPPVAAKAAPVAAASAGPRPAQSPSAPPRGPARQPAQPPSGPRGPSHSSTPTGPRTPPPASAPVGPQVRAMAVLPTSGELKLPAKKQEKARVAAKPKVEAKPEVDYLKGMKAEVLIETVDEQEEQRNRKNPKKTRIVLSDRRRPSRPQEIKKTEITVPKASKRVIKVPGSITVADLSQKMGVKAGDLLKKLLLLDIPATINQSIDLNVASMLAEDYEYKVESAGFEVDEALEQEAPPDKPEDLEVRAPVVTIMGHVDHGKTSLLDHIRKSNVAGGEAGAITQHIGAYQVYAHDRPIVFLDTPGHEAFTAMRARGAKVTDIVVLVVSAADSTQPQTIESIGHARAAGIPLIVAINKIDLPTAQPDRVKQDLMKYEVVAEEFGGDVMMFPLSAKTGQGVPDLLDGILLQADVLDLKANPKKAFKGTIIEAHLDKGRGVIATALAQEGTLCRGDIVVTGSQYGRIKRILNDRDEDIRQAGPSTPVQLLGLSGLPNAGDDIQSVANERLAKQISEHRAQLLRNKELAQGRKVSLESFQQQIAEGGAKELHVLVKADVQGSVEAIQNALEKLNSREVKIKVIHAAAGGINQSDVLLAGISKAILIGFNVRPDSVAKQTAEEQGIEIRSYSIIYDIVDDIRAAMEGMLDPAFKETVIGHLEVREVFNLAKTGPVAGCQVADGKVRQGARARVLRDQTVIYTGEIGSLRRFKDAAREVSAGMECGATLKNYRDLKVGDVLEIFEVEQVAQTLTPLATA